MVIILENKMEYKDVDLYALRSRAAGSGTGCTPVSIEELNAINNEIERLKALERELRLSHLDN